MVFGLFASVANDLMFLSVQVWLLIYTCYGPITCLHLCTVYTMYFNGFEAAVSAWIWMVLGLFASVANDHMFLSVHVRLFIYTCYGPLTLFDLCILSILCILTVLKLASRHREARLRTLAF